MKFRTLRIVISTVCGCACVLTIVLWLRSAWWVEGMTLPVSSNASIEMGSVVGTFAIGINEDAPPLDSVQIPAEQWKTRQPSTVPSPIWGGFVSQGRETILLIPDWVLVCFFAAIGVAPWARQMRWQFSLRTLLITMTLVATALGWAVYLSRK
jgi:hypothetical protein